MRAVGLAQTGYGNRYTYTTGTDTCRLQRPAHAGYGERYTQTTGTGTRILRGPAHASYVDRHTQTTGTGKTSYGDRITHTARFTQDTLTMAGV